MNSLCEEGKCCVMRSMRLALVLGGAYHILFTVWIYFWPHQLFDFLNLPHPSQLTLWRILSLLWGMLGLCMIIAAKDPIRHWLVALLGLIKSSAAIFIASSAIFKTDLPLSAILIIAVDDLIWLPFFILILWAAIRAFAGIPTSRREPYSVAEAAAVYELSNGKKLSDASAEKPLVLVFLRHFGCTFTRQILRGLQSLEQQAKQNDATLVVVHMLQSGEEVSYLGQNSDVLRIADPRCELYRAFGLGKGGFIELFGPQVWWRGAVSLFKGCGVGHLAGDGLQMPGAFVFHNGEIIAAQPSHSAADLPDLEALFVGKADLTNSSAQN